MWQFSSEERRGLTIWCLCILSISLTPLLLPDSNDNTNLELLLKTWSQDTLVMPSKPNKGGALEIDSYDPNAVTAKQLQHRGLPSFIAERWVRFRAAKGGFSNVKDIQSIFGIDSIWIEKERDFWNWTESDSPKEKNGSALNTKNKKHTAQYSDQKPHQPQKTLKPIDINQADASQFQKLGFKKGVAHRLIAYRKKAGPFYHPEDLYAIYDIDSPLVRELIPFLLIDTARLPYLDINSAMQTELESLPGIGPVYADRIVKFRDALGGFIQKEQLKEVYGIPESTWIRISPRVRSKSNEIKKIKVNSAELKDFARHPYIDWNLAKRLFRYREQHYPISSLSGMHGLSEEKIDQLSPYLDFSHKVMSDGNVALSSEGPK